MSELSEQEKGVKAITTLLEVLGTLQEDTRSNVLDYVFRTLKITLPATAAAPAALQAPRPPGFTSPMTPPLPPQLPGAVTDIRSLTEQKKPKTVSHMVAIMAYYLANYAPPAERREHIVADDIKRYFKPANFPLPTGRPDVTLNNAKNAGYLDAIGEGKYRLNPVGDNLVAHKLPPQEGSSSTSAPRRGRSPKKVKKAKKKAKK